MLGLFFLLLVWMAFTPLARRLEQRSTIKVLQKAGHTPIQIWCGLNAVFGNECLSKTQVRQWFNRFKEGDLTTTTADRKHPGRATKKTMLVLFFDTAGPVHTEFVPAGATVDTDLWIAILKNLRESIRRKRPIMWRGGFDGATNNDFILHMDNASSHVSNPSLAFYGENDIRLLAHPAYSPDLAPCDFWAFPTLKSHLRGHKFGNLEELQAEARRVLRAIPSEDYQSAIYDMAVRWSKCVEADGEYFEGRNIPFNPDHLPQDSSSDSD